MGVGKGAGGILATLDFETVSKKDCFLSFEWEKNNVHHFWHPLEKFWKTPTISSPWKKFF